MGYGYSARTFHVPLIGAAAGFSLAAVCSSRPEAVHADLPGMRVVSSVDEAVRLPEADVVLIATPNPTHAPLAIAALEAGKHVIVEKPFTLTLDDARGVMRRAQAAGRRLTVFHNRRWDADFLGARGMLASGVLGELSHYESHFDRYRPAVRDRWRERAGPGAGLWFDIGPHLVDQALQLFGLPDRVHADFSAQRPRAETEDWAHVVLDYGPLRAVLHASLLVAGPEMRFTLHGAAGSWTKDGLDVQERQLVAGLRPGAADWGRDPIAATRWIGASGERIAESVPRGSYERFYAGLHEALDDDTQLLPVTPTEALAVMAVVIAAAESAASSRAIVPAIGSDERTAFTRDRQARAVTAASWAAPNGL